MHADPFAQRDEVRKLERDERRIMARIAFWGVKPVIIGLYAFARSIWLEASLLYLALISGPEQPRNRLRRADRQARRAPLAGSAAIVIRPGQVILQVTPPPGCPPRVAVILRRAEREGWWWLDEPYAERRVPSHAIENPMLWQVIAEPITARPAHELDPPAQLERATTSRRPGASTGTG